MGVIVPRSIAMLETVTTQILEGVYQAGALQLTRLAHGTKDVFRVRRTSAPDWMLRIYPVTDPAPVHDRVSALAQLLVFLEQQHYPAERLVRTVTGALTTRSAARHILVTTYLGSPQQAWQPASTGGSDPNHIQAATAKHDPQLLFSIGALLGRLHALDTTGSDAKLIRAPGLQAAAELAWASSQLAQLQARVPGHLQEELACLNTRIQQIRSFDACAQTIIHGDGHLGNVVITPTNDYAFIDWEAAGRGAAVTDLGQLLNASVEPSDTTLHMTGIQAIIDGYWAHRMVSPIERDLLADALRFRILVTLAGAFEQRSRPDYQPTQRFWGATYAEWERHERRATRIATIAQARLDALLVAGA
jgi:Ser/Thr protein kinase RdoA (MazF antagonist)